MIYPRFIKFFCIVILASVNMASAKEDKLSVLLRQSIEVAQTIPYDGVIVFRYKIHEGEVTSKIKAQRYSSEVQRMEILEPEVLKKHIITRINDVTWMSPVSKEDMMKLPEEIRYYHWYLISRDITAAIKHEELDLFLKNYQLVEEDSCQVAQRKVKTIYITGLYRHRPSLRIWIDYKTKMPLKYEIYDSEKQVTKSVEFERIDFIKDNEEDMINTEGLEKITPPKRNNDNNVEELDFKPLCLETLPQGFEELASHSWKHEHGIIYETQYRDGFANFTIYQRKQTEEERENQLKEPKEEQDKAKKIIRFGREIYYRDLNGVRVSVVGSGVHAKGLRYLIYHVAPNLSDEKSQQKKPQKAQ